MHGRVYNTYQLVAQELWQHKQTSSSGFTLGISSFTACHNSWAPSHNIVYMSVVCNAYKLQGDTITVRALLQQGAEPNAKDNAGWTPLVRL